MPDYAHRKDHLADIGRNRLARRCTYPVVLIHSSPR